MLSPSGRTLSWPLLNEIFLKSDNSDSTEHVLVPAGHMALVEGWHVSAGKAAVVLGLQAMLNAIPIWMSLRAQIGLSGPPDWSDRQGTARALAMTTFADWTCNITDTLYLQGIRSQLHALPNWVQEFLASTATCFLDVVLTTPIFFYWQTAVAEPDVSMKDILSSHGFGDLYAGAGAMLVGNLVFMNVFYPLNELSIKACKAEHSLWRQVAIGITASLVATTSAWPAGWVRAQLSMPAHQGESSWDVLSDVQFSLPKIFKGFPAQLMVAVMGGVFSGLANKFMRHVPQPHPHVSSVSEEVNSACSSLTESDAV
jgi:hypothetical protein